MNRSSRLKGILSLSVWWTNPAYLTIFLILPIFLICCLLGGETLKIQGAPNSYFTNLNTFLGALSLSLFAAGSIVGSKMGGGGRSLLSLEPRDIDRAIGVTGGIALLAYVVFLSPLAWNLDALASYFSGSSSVRFRYIFNQMPGVTSLIQFGHVAASLFSARLIFVKKPVPTWMKWLICFIVVATIFRAILNSERLALIELIFSFCVAQSVFRKNRSLWISFAPIIGLMFIFMLFSFAEYFRSWQAYKGTFNGGVMTFMLLRFLAYFTTSINNGAGMMEIYSPLYYPALSGAWFFKFPLWPLIGLDLDRGNPTTAFLEQYGNPEFNNPGGMFVLLVDFGWPFGLFAMLVFGIIAGNLYRRFRKGGVVGIVLFPCWLAGVSDLTRILYWTETRAFSIVLGAGLALLLLSGKRSTAGK